VENGHRRMKRVDPLLELFGQAGPDIDLAHAALLVARDAYPALDVNAYLSRIDAMATALRPVTQAAPDAASRLQAINHYLFTELGFRGNQEEYYDPRNSYLNEVMDRRLGIPITLAVLYIAVGRRLGLPLEGVNFPLHFLVRCPAEPESLLVDPFEGGHLTSRLDLEKRLAEAFKPPMELEERFLRSAEPGQILARLLRNLKQIYSRQEDYRRAAALGERIVQLDPKEAHDYRELGLLYYRLGSYPRSLEAFRAYLSLATDPEERNKVRRQIHHMYARLGRLN
jgi:regulator of sirC expression with transglutaminase-like and TPR domain